MMERVHVRDDPSNIGYYRGLADSCFAIAQLLTVSITPFFHISPILLFAHHHHRMVPQSQIYQWSNWSASIGRKPVIIIGLTGVTLRSFCVRLTESLVSSNTSLSFTLLSHSHNMLYHSNV